MRLRNKTQPRDNIEGPLAGCQWSVSMTTDLDVVVLGAGHYTDVAIGRVCVVHRQHHDRCLVTAGQLAHRLETDQHNNTWSVVTHFSKAWVIL